MTVSQILSKFKQPAGQAEHTENSSPSTPSGSASLKEKNGEQYDDSPVAYLTWRSFILGLIASMGGFIFGYSTGMFAVKNQATTRLILTDMEVKSPVSKQWVISSCGSRSITRPRTRITSVTSVLG